MRFLAHAATLVFLLTLSVFAAPMEEVDLSPLNFPESNLTTLFATADSLTPKCPRNNECGVVTFASGTYVSFGEGICMQISGNVQSIYVAHCYCSIWSKCTGSSKTDVYVGGMIMCQKPRLRSSFTNEPKFISCGGRNSAAA